MLIISPSLRLRPENSISYYNPDSFHNVSQYSSIKGVLRSTSKTHVRPLVVHNSLIPVNALAVSFAQHMLYLSTQSDGALGTAAMRMGESDDIEMRTKGDKNKTHI
jgi:hypothetical protein